MNVRKRSFDLFSLLALTAGLSACGGSGGTQTPTPNASPLLPSLSASPTSIALTAIGQAKTFAVNGSSVTATSSNGTIAKVAPGTAPGTFVVTATGDGAATIALSASGYASASLPVAVTITNLTPQ